MFWEVFCIFPKIICTACHHLTMSKKHTISANVHETGSVHVFCVHHVFFHWRAQFVCVLAHAFSRLLLTNFIKKCVFRSPEVDYLASNAAHVVGVVPWTMDLYDRALPGDVQSQASAVRVFFNVHHQTGNEGTVCLALPARPNMELKGLRWWPSS